jgi:KipI family sensor histidine kinase inhibitor
VRLAPVGSAAVLVELADLDAVLALGAALADEPLPGVVEVVPAARTVLLRWASARDLRRAAGLPGLPGLQAQLERRLAGAAARGPEGAGGGGDVVEVPVRYDGEDLAEVARLTGLRPAEVVRAHTGTDWTVAFTGFAPGFAYLAGGDPALRVPRRATPRTRVPAGAVGLAGELSGVYPRASPGGWQLLGTTDLPVWDVERDPPALLRPGARVRFVDVTGSPPAPVAEAQPLRLPVVRAREVGCGLEVLDPGPSTLVQDLGRPGRADLSVSASGARDRAALRRANRAVGNAAGAPALEAAGGLVVAARGPVVVAVTGGAADPVTRSRSSGPRSAPRGAPLPLDDGDELELPGGAPSVLAVRGGLDVPLVLGSASRDVLAGLGPEPLLAGAVLGLGPGSRWLEGSAAVLAAPEPAAAGVRDVVLDVVLGPRDDWFDAPSVQLLLEQEWRVTPRSDRVGARLEGAVPLRRVDGGERELPSEGAVRGALQVPPDGQPVLFGPDHPVTGGYPVVACVAEHHLDAAGALPPGAVVRFRVVVPG